VFAVSEFIMGHEIIARHSESQLDCTTCASLFASTALDYVDEVVIEDVRLAVLLLPREQVDRGCSAAGIWIVTECGFEYPASLELGRKRSREILLKRAAYRVIELIRGSR